MLNAEVHREIWQGKLPLCFNINSDDVSGMQQPEPYFMMVPRVTYFPLVLDRVVKYFNRFLDQGKDTLNEMWLDYDGQPIKWHHPVGLSWDLFGSSSDLPWRLILHFSKFPTEDLVRCNTKELIEANFMASVKEADALKHKSLVVKNLVKKEFNQLWSGLAYDKFDQFWQVNRKLMERSDNELFNSIPFRLYLPDYTYVQKIIKPLTTDRHMFIIREKPGIVPNQSHKIPLLENYDKNVTDYVQVKETTCAGNRKRWTTLLDLIQVSFSDRINDLIIKRSKDDAQSKETETRLAGDIIDIDDFRYRFLTHGIDIPLDAPLQWLSENMSYPDNFLHICAVPKDRQEYP